MFPSHTPGGYLPTGIYEVTLQEIESMLGSSTIKRKELFKGLEKAIDNMSHAGVKILYLGGSFVTKDPAPKDVDGCWEADGVNLDLLDPVLLDFKYRRKRMKWK